MGNESFYSLQTTEIRAKKIFRFFSEIPFSSPDDPALFQKGSQSKPSIDIFRPRHQLPCPQYHYLRCRHLESLEGYFPQPGVWSTSSRRVSRFWGDSPNIEEVSIADQQIMDAFFHDSHWEETGDFNWDKIDQAKIIDAKKGRTLFYHRVDVLKSWYNLQHYDSFKEFPVKTFYPGFCHSENDNDYKYILSINLTPEWHTLPQEGILRIPSSPNVLGSHCVAVVARVPEGIVIKNSWGFEWGEGGHCVIPLDVVNANIIDAWHTGSPGIFPRFKSTHGLVCLSWKTNSIPPFPEIYCEEIVDASSGERLAWAFVTHNADGELVVEEFFVWPEYRKRGYARILANRLKLLGEITNRPLVMLVSWADCETHKLAGVIKTAEMLGLSLMRSDTRVAGLIGRKTKIIRNACITNLRDQSIKSGILPPEPNEIAPTLDVPFRPELPRDELRPKKVPVWFATNREPIEKSDELRFGEKISEKVTYGRCDVTIPKWHCFGKIKTGPWQRWLARFLWGDKSVHEVNYPLLVLEEESFWAMVTQSFAQTQQDGYKSDGLVFLHGYNNSFDNAAIYAGQLAFDLKIPNIAFFSWPSRGKLRAYLQDEETIRLCENAIFDFLVQFSNACPTGKIHIIAHSMGNRGLLSAFYPRILHEAGKHFQEKRIGQVFLAAPDVNTEEFKKHVAGIVQVSERVTLYTAKQDRALRLSRLLHQYPRAGTAPPFTIVDGVDTIHVPRISSREDNMKHSYFAKMAPLLYDMDSLIKSNHPPHDRIRLRQMTTESQIYWEFTQ